MISEVLRKNVDCSSHMAVSSMAANLFENVNRETTSLRLAVWTVSGKGYLQQEFQRGLPSLFIKVQGDKVHYQITIRPGQSGLAGVVKEKLIHFDVL